MLSPLLQDLHLPPVAKKLHCIADQSLSMSPSIFQHFLGDAPNATVVAPLDYPAMVESLLQARAILTDSGGIQEEAPSLGKPVLVMRDTTERPEAVAAGTVRLVGTDHTRIVKETLVLLQESTAYQRMTFAHNPYGDGVACQRIRHTFEKLATSATT